MLICTFLKDIPDVVWSGLIASFLTLSGVLLSNWSNTSRLKLQLRHDADEKSKQRKADLRKEVYLKAAEELVKANAHLASIPQLDFTKVNAADGMLGFFAAASKLQLVAEEKTSLLVMQLVGIYGDLMMKIVLQAMPIQHFQTNISICTEHYDRTQNEITRLLAAMAQHNESRNTDQEAFQVLTKSFKFQQDQANKFAEERNDLGARKNAAHIAFVREFIPEMKVIGERGVRLIVEIRKEFDVGGNIDIFMSQMEEQWQKMSARLDATLSGFENASKRA